MNKTLKLIQTLAKIGKIISTIIFILCIVGAAGCFLGLVGCAIFGSINFGDKSLVDIIYEQTGKEMNMAEVYLQLIAGIVACAVECILAKFCASSMLLRMRASIT